MDQRAPRNIRDIAHLYISKSKRNRNVGRRGRREAARVIVAGVSRECFPGFHAANLAAALAKTGRRVRLVELSGLLPNAARFLALPPRVYICGPGRREAAHPVSALDGVTVWFRAPPSADGDEGRLAVDLVHLPPLDSEAEFEAARRNVGDGPWLLIADAARDVPADRVVGPRARTLVVGRAAPRQDDEPSVAGRVVRWRRALADGLPAVVRDPRSLMSRSYLECSARLLDDGSAHERPIARAARLGQVAR